MKALRTAWDRPELITRQAAATRISEVAGMVNRGAGNPDRVDRHCASIAKLAQRHRRSRLRAPAASAAKAERLGGLKVDHEFEFGRRDKTVEARP